MKNCILLLLLSVLLANCTITTAQTVKPEVIEKGSCLTAAPVCAPHLASNISETPRTLAAIFDGYEVFMGKNWNSLMIFQDDTVLYSGAREYYMLDYNTMIVEGGGWAVAINLDKGTGNIVTPDHKNIELSPATYSGPVLGSN